MEMKAHATVRGAKMFTGDLDGKKIDSGKLYIEVKLKESDNSFGMCTQEMKCKNSAVVQSIKHLQFPFLAEIDIDLVSGSKGAEQTVTAVRPMKRIAEGATPAARAAATA